MTVAQQLATWGVSVALDDVPEVAQRAAVRHLLDGTGAALAARRLGVVHPALAVATGLGGPGEATILGGRVRVSAPVAAYATGALVHGLDFDDTHAGGLVHATSVVLPAALAVGEQVGASGREILTAAIVGYETVCRIAMASPHGFHARGLHASQVAGVFSAAIVAARLLRLNPDTAVNALGIAGSSAGGLLEFLTTGASTKQLHPASAALNGILAARLAAAGATGPATVFEGPNGIYATLSARLVDLSAITGQLGSRWEVTRIAVKLYPSCQLMHATLDAVAAAIGTTEVPPGDIVEIVADVHPDSAQVVCEPAEFKIAPRTAYDAKFSLPWSVAALLCDGRLGIDSYRDQALRRADVGALAARVRTRISRDDGVAAEAAGSVRIVLRDGRVLTGAVPQSRGGAAMPVTDHELQQKFIDNTGNSAVAPELAERVLALAGEANVEAIVEAAARTMEP